MSFEQIADSIVVTVFSADQPDLRRAALVGGFSVLARLVRDAGVDFHPTGIIIGEDTLRWPRVTIAAAVRLPEKGWSIRLDTLTAAGLSNDNRCAAGEEMILQSGEFIFGSLFQWGGRVEISGEVGGQVICLGGPVFLRPGAVIRGSVFVLGGRLDQQAPAKVYGGTYSDREFSYHPVGVSREWEYEGDRYGFRPSFTYDKVDGARPGIRMFFQDSWLTPRIGFWTAYALTSEKWQYRLFFEQRLASSRDVRIGGAYTRATETEDELFIHSLENTLVALLANEDYRDYYGRHGARFWLAAELYERHLATMEYHNFTYRWRSTSPELWSLFWSGRDFRRNFFALRGLADELLQRETFERRISMLRLGYQIAEPERDRYTPGLGYCFDGFWEVAGGVLQGEWDYYRVFARTTWWYDLAGRHRLLLRIYGGKTVNRTPAPQLFSLGGPASLRGFRVKQLVGDELLLVTFEYAARFWENKITDASVVLFADCGRASLGREFWLLRRFKVDLGAALDFGGGFRLAVAQAVGQPEMKPAVTLRIKAGL